MRRDGFAVNNEELAYGLRSIAAPVRQSDGAVAAAINLAVHSSMVSMQELVARLTPGAAADGGRDLGADGLQALVQRAEMYSVR